MIRMGGKPDASLKSLGIVGITCIDSFNSVIAARLFLESVPSAAMWRLADRSIDQQ